MSTERAISTFLRSWLVWLRSLLGAWLAGDRSNDLPCDCLACQVRAQLFAPDGESLARPNLHRHSGELWAYRVGGQIAYLPPEQSCYLRGGHPRCLALHVLYSLRVGQHGMNTRWARAFARFQNFFRRIRVPKRLPKAIEFREVNIAGPPLAHTPAFSNLAHHRPRTPRGGQ